MGMSLGECSKTIIIRWVGREENIKNAIAVATYLNKKGMDGDWTAVYCQETPNSIKGRPVNKETDVVMSLVNPYEHLRNELRATNICKRDGWCRDEVVEILLRSDRDLRKEYHAKDFEEGTPNYVLNTDRDVEDSWAELKGILQI